MVRSLKVIKGQKWVYILDVVATNRADDDFNSIELGAVRHDFDAYAICVRDMPIEE